MLFVLTPTDGRPEAFALLERWIGSQDFPDPFRWIVGTRDASPYRFNSNQITVERPNPPSGMHPLPWNLLSCFEAMDLREGDLACCVEDDDYYAPGYLGRLTALAEGVPLAGQSHARYYNIGTGRYQQLRNEGHASLAQTAFRAPALPLLRAICLRGGPSVDRPLWAEWPGPKRLEPSDCHVGVKSMPGARGVGVGHRTTFGRPDTNRRIFKEWGLPAEYLKYAWQPNSRA